MGILFLSSVFFFPDQFSEIEVSFFSLAALYFFSRALFFGEKEINIRTNIFLEYLFLFLGLFSGLVLTGIFLLLLKLAIIGWEGIQTINYLQNLFPTPLFIFILSVFFLIILLLVFEKHHQIKIKKKLHPLDFNHYKRIRRKKGSKISDIFGMIFLILIFLTTMVALILLVLRDFFDTSLFNY
jgi:hypothetical protein